MRGDGGAEGGLFGVGEEAFEGVGGGFGGVEKGDVGTDVGGWWVAVGFAGVIEIPVMKAVSGAGVDGSLDLSQCHRGCSMIGVVVVSWEVECCDDGGPEIILIEV